MSDTKKENVETVTISAPNIQRAQFNIVGTAPYVQLRFSAKAMNKMREQHEAEVNAQINRAAWERERSELEARIRALGGTPPPRPTP